jgi:hypothetical protein
LVESFERGIENRMKGLIIILLFVYQFNGKTEGMTAWEEDPPSPTRFNQSTTPLHAMK